MMKKIITIFFLLVCFINSFSQTPPFIIRSSGAFIPEDKYLKVGFGGSGAFYMPTASDTSHALIGFADSVGLQVYSISDSSVYVRIPKPVGVGNKWIKLLRFGDANSGSLSSIALIMPTGFNVSGSPLTSNGTITVSGAGTTLQYIRGDGSLAAFPTIPAQFNPIAGTGITLTGSYPNITFNSTNSGTVSNFSAGNLVPLFTTSVSTSTTTPSLSFTLSNVSNHLFFGNNSGSTGPPSFVSIGIGDLPTGIPNANLQFSTIGLSTGTSGTDVGVTGSPASLGGSLTLNIPIASATNTGKLSNSDWLTFNSKVGTIGTLNSQPKSANGGVITGGSLVFQTSDATHPGLITSSEFGFLDSLQRGLLTDTIHVIPVGTTGFQTIYGNGTNNIFAKRLNGAVQNNNDSTITVLGGGLDSVSIKKSSLGVQDSLKNYVGATGTFRGLVPQDRYTFLNNTIVPIDTLNGLWRADAASSLLTSDGYIIFLFSNFFTTFTGDGNQCRIGAVRSLDRGRTYSAPYIAFPQTFHFGSYIPSMWEVNPNDIRAFILGRDGTGSNIYITNEYIIKSTDHGLTWSLIDSLYSPRPNFYVASASNRVTTDPQNKAIKYFAFEYNTGTSNPLSLTANYHGKIAKSTDTGKTWTVLPIEILSPDSATNEGGIIFPQKNFNQAGFDISQKMTYYWRTEALGNVWANDSYDNGTTFQGAYNTGIGAPGSTSTLITVNNKSYILALHNLYPSTNLGRSGQPWSRLYMMLSASADNGRTWQDLTTLWGIDFPWHFFEPIMLYDSTNQNLIVYVSRMDSLQHLSSIESKVVDIGRALSSHHLVENMATLKILANADVMTNVQDGILTIGNLNLGTTAGFFKIGSSGGSIGTFDPQVSAKSNNDIAAGLILRSQMGQDNNVAYYSAGYAFDALSPSNGTLSTGFIAKFSNNHVEKFTIGPTGKLFMYDTISAVARGSYNTNLHSTFTQYSWVDKSYVDSVTGGGSGGSTIFKGWDSMLLAAIPQSANRIQSLGNHDITFTNLTANGWKMQGASPKFWLNDTTTSNATFNISDNGGGIFMNSGSGIIAYIFDKSTRFLPQSPDNNYPLNSGDFIITTNSSLVDHFKLSVTSTATASANSSMRNTGSFAPTSGSASWNFWLLDATVNQTGGASGITRGIYLNPTITAAADWRAIEVATGDVILNGQNLKFVHPSGLGSAPTTNTLGTNVTSATISGHDGYYKMVVVMSGSITNASAVCNIAFNSAWPTSEPYIIVGTKDPTTANACTAYSCAPVSGSAAVFTANISGAGTYTFYFHVGD